MDEFFKYPRTPHIRGSNLQKGDDPEDIPLDLLKGKFLVIEEKIDGANSAISFSEDKAIILQSRGHILSGGGREKQFDLFKSWATSHSAELWDCLGSTLIMYGEWCFAKHSEFYDQLPHYFLEFDIFDKEKKEFWSTELRHELLPSFICHVPVLSSGMCPSTLDKLTSFITHSLYKSKDWSKKLEQQAKDFNLDINLIKKQTDMTGLAEGLYIKWEDSGTVKGRYKFVRSEFIQHLVNGDDHWMDRPILPNICINSDLWT